MRIQSARNIKVSLPSPLPGALFVLPRKHQKWHLTCCEIKASVPSLRWISGGGIQGQVKVPCFLRKDCTSTNEQLWKAMSLGLSKIGKPTQPNNVKYSGLQRVLSRQTKKDCPETVSTRSLGIVSLESANEASIVGTKVHEQLWQLALASLPWSCT